MDGPRTLGPDPIASAGDSGFQVGSVATPHPRPLLGRGGEGILRTLSIELLGEYSVNSSGARRRKRVCYSSRNYRYRRRPGANDFGNGGPGGGPARRRAAVLPKTALSQTAEGG